MPDLSGELAAAVGICMHNAYFEHVILDFLSLCLRNYGRYV